MIVYGLVGLISGIGILVTALVIGEFGVAAFGAALIPPSLYLIWWFIKGP